MSPADSVSEEEWHVAPCDRTGIQEYREGMSISELLEDPVRQPIEEILTNFYTARCGCTHILALTRLSGPLTASRG